MLYIGFLNNEELDFFLYWMIYREIKKNKETDGVEIHSIYVDKQDFLCFAVNSF